LKTKVKLLFGIIILLTLMYSCKKDQNQIIPYVKVQITANLDLPQFSDLNFVGNAVLYPNVGYNNNGVIIYRNSTDEFTAYDATCPQHIDTKTAIKLTGGGEATCPYCKTVYYLSAYGTPSKGYSLKQYGVTKSGSFIYINN